MIRGPGNGRLRLIKNLLRRMIRKRASVNIAVKGVTKTRTKCPLCPDFDCLVFFDYLFMKLYRYIKNIESGTISVLVYVQAVVNQLGSSYMRAVEIL